LEGFVSVGPSQTASAGDLTLHGQLLDYNRPAVLTVMAALGIIAALHSWRSVTSRISVALFFLSTFFYVLLPSWPVLNWLFLGHIFPPQRFVGPTQLAAILLIGIAGDWMWSMASALGLWRPFAVGATIVALMIPTLRERYAFYRADAQYIARFGKLEADSNWRDIIATLKAMPRGRTYLKVRARSVDGLSPLSRVLLYDDIETLQTAVSLSLNVALQLDFDDTNQAHYDVFNIRYVIAPRAFDVPAFLTLIKSNSSFALYRAETTGYAEFVKLRNVVILGSLTQAQKEMLRGQREWLSGSEPWRAVYPRWIVPAMALSAVAAPEQEFPPDASILDEKVRAGQFIFHAECHAPSNLVVKSAYNPNWHVTIDGIEQPTFAVAPNFLAVSVPAGRHEIVAEYRSTRVKKLLLILGVAVAVCTLVFCRRISAIERIWAFRYLSDPAGDRGTAGALRNKNSDLYR